MPQMRVRTFTLLCAASLAAVAGSGCVRSLSELDQHTRAFSSAAILVTNSSENAYSSANQLHDQQQIARAVADYNKSLSWNPGKYLNSLLTEDQLLARRQVLDGLRSYAATLADLTSRGGNTGLDTAATDTGASLQNFSKTIAGRFGTSSGISITDQQKNILSTALFALGKYLQQRTVSKELPTAIQASDPTVASICDVLLADIAILKRQSVVDFGEVQIAQNEYILKASPPLTSDQRRVEVANLIALVRKQQQNTLLLSTLEKSIANLKATHHALADAARGNNPTSLRQSIAQLTAEGESLAAFYGSLSAS